MSTNVSMVCKSFYNRMCSSLSEYVIQRGIIASVLMCDCLLIIYVGVKSE